MKLHSPLLLIPLWCASVAHADLLRYADRLIDYTQGPGAQPGYTWPPAALGAPSTGHTPATVLNDDLDTGEPLVVSLGQGGSITLGFNTPVRNQGPSEANPWGYDLLIWGNTFQGGAAVTPEGRFGRFHEHGFVEVAQGDENGQPIEWFLILPRIFFDPLRNDPVPRDFTPAELLPPVFDIFGDFIESGDLSVSECLFDGFADVVPAQGAVLQAVLESGDLADVILDDPTTFAIEGLGGSGIDLSRAVRQSTPGVPLVIDGAFQFVFPERIDLIRITDAHTSDVHPGAQGPITTEVDGVIVLPDLRGCNVPFADADGDGDVDMDDFGTFQRCISGDGQPADLACTCFDRDGDGDVDSVEPGGTSDFEAFRRCVSGPAVPANPECEE